MMVFLAGEGRHELGDWCRSLLDRSSPPTVGIIEALLRRIRSEGWVVADARCWKDIRKYRPGDHAKREERNVRGVALQATEAGCGVLAFVRDGDGDPTRGTQVENGIAAATEDHTGAPLAIAGGVAVQEVESWILSLRGEQNAERLKDPKKRLEAIGDSSSTVEMVATIDRADLTILPTDAQSLGIWIQRARQAMIFE